MVILVGPKVTDLATICRLLIEGDTKLADILSRRILAERAMTASIILVR